MCSSFDPSCIESLQNVEETTIHTKTKHSFDKFIIISLVVKEDGTAIPKFIYKKCRDSEGSVSAKGKPFYLDMTHGHVGGFSKAYIGFDFGTSNSSVSFVDQKSVEIFEKRSSEKGWKSLNDVLGELPYPIANPLADFLSETNPEQSVKKAFKFFEATLALGAYLAYLEYCSKIKSINSKIFKGFTHRSAGPLWKLLKDSLHGLGKKAEFSLPMLELVQEHGQTVDQAIRFFNDLKHDKLDERSFDYLRFVNLIANISHKTYRENHFGLFNNVKKQRFGSKYSGNFFIAHGNPPFVRHFGYSGNEAFSEDQPFIYNKSKQRALCLQPLMFWNYCDLHVENNFGHIFMYDKFSEKEKCFEYMTVNYSCLTKICQDSEFEGLFDLLSKIKSQDVPFYEFSL